MKLGNPKRLPVSLKLAVLAAALSFTLAWQVPSGQEDDDPRGIYPIFKSTRKKPAATPTPARKNQPENKEPVVGSKPGAPAPIGIGYSLYQRNNLGEAVRVDPETRFKTGDSARFVIEPNINGYLYIFHAENDGPPKMIFPDHRLDEGDNTIKAHVPYEVPSRKWSRWFAFKGNPATENLYLVVTREPLPGVPTGSKLDDFCQQNVKECPWKPAKAQFDLVLGKAGEVKTASSLKELGKSQSPVESEAIVKARDLELSAPEPSLVVMNVSAKQDILVMKTQLIHVKH
jgi:hypothetical protein